MAVHDLDRDHAAILQNKNRGYVYYREIVPALAAFASSNGLDPTAFPSLLRMENEVVAIEPGVEIAAQPVAHVFAAPHVGELAPFVDVAIFRRLQLL